MTEQEILDKSLVNAVLQTDLTKVRFLLERGANPNAKYLENREFCWYEPVVYLVAKRGDAAMLQDFIDHDVKVDAFLLDAAEHSKEPEKPVSIIRAEMRRRDILKLIFSKGRNNFERF